MPLLVCLRPPRASSRAPTTPGSILLPARLHTTVAPLAATASAMRLDVVVLPLVPVITTLRSTKLARSLSSSGSIFIAMRPGSTPPWRLRTERSPQRAISLEVQARDERRFMKPFLT